MSLITRPRSRSFPSESMTPGRSVPGRPYRTSFILRASRVPDADDLANQRRLVVAFDLDRHLGAHAHAVARHFLGARDPLADADARARLHRRDEADLVRAVVDAAASLGNLEEARGHARDERESEIAVGDRLAAGHLALGALDVDVDPLVIAGRFRELVDHPLVDRHPLRRAKLRAD